MFSFAGLDVDVAASVFANHNDYIVDYCSVAPERLVGIGCLPIPDVDAAIAEMQRAGARGVRGFMVPAHVDPERPYHHPDYDRFWASLQDIGAAADDAHLHRHGLAHRPRRALGTAGIDDQGLHVRSYVGGQHRHRPHLRRRVRALPRRACRRVGVRDRLGVALPPAPRSRDLPHTQVRRRLPDDEAERLLPSQRVDHVRGRPRRHRHPPLDRRQQPAAGATTTPTTTRSGRTR